MQKQSTFEPLSEELKQEMINKSIEVQQIAYAPYSKFHVGACILADNGELYTGCNIENQSYGLTICAERCAVCKMCSNNRRIIKVLVVSTNIGVSPCGACRQVLQEFADPETKDFPVYIVNSETREVLETSIKQLLPNAVDLFFLKNE
ncbi:hypothetical protein ABK040_008459 [Willaertia magna]